LYIGITAEVIDVLNAKRLM